MKPPKKAVTWGAAIVAVLSACVSTVVGEISGQPLIDELLEPSLRNKIAANHNAIVDALVTFNGPPSAGDLEALRGVRLEVVRVFDQFGIVYVVGLGTDLLRLATLENVRRVSENAPLEYYGETATVATRAREAWDAKSTSTDPVLVGGSTVNGVGVGIAIIDSGIDASHPDLSSAVALNQKFVCTTPGIIYVPTQTCYGDAIIGIILTGTPYTGCTNTFWVPLADTDTTSGHGTHVAGIVAGRGVASDARYMGAAPGATIIGLGVGEGLSILYALEALNWIDCNAAAYDIEIVSNSWGRNAAYSASDPINVAVSALVADGLVVVFATGNDAGTGSSNNVNTYARNPTAGVIGVANYDDTGTATRTGSLASSSSRCLVGGGGVVPVASVCPDVSAPGTSITSTVSKAGLIPPLELRYMPYYGPATGTSMAAPHVAGVAALLLQADPTLTPAEVEDILEDTAIQFTTPGGYPAGSDPSNPTNGINYGAGHGLVDAIAALQDSRVLGSTGLGSPLPQLRQNPHVYTEGVVDPMVAGGVPPTFNLQWSQVNGRPVSLAERTIVSGNAVTYGVSSGQSANFRVEAPGGSITNLGTTLAGDSGGTLQMTASYTFPAAGTYTIESQISFSGSLVSFDAFRVRVLP